MGFYMRFLSSCAVYSVLSYLPRNDDGGGAGGGVRLPLSAFDLDGIVVALTRSLYLASAGALFPGPSYESVWFNSYAFMPRIPLKC